MLAATHFIVAFYCFHHGSGTPVLPAPGTRPPLGPLLCTSTPIILSICLDETEAVLLWVRQEPAPLPSRLTVPVLSTDPDLGKAPPPPLMHTHTGCLATTSTPSEYSYLACICLLLRSRVQYYVGGRGVARSRASDGKKTRFRYKWLDMLRDRSAYRPLLLSSSRRRRILSFPSQFLPDKLRSFILSLPIWQVSLLFLVSYWPFHSLHCKSIFLGFYQTFSSRKHPFHPLLRHNVCAPSPSLTIRDLPSCRPTTAVVLQNIIQTSLLNLTLHQSTCSSSTPYPSA